MEMISKSGQQIVDRIAHALETAYEQDIDNADQEHKRLIDQTLLQEKVYQRSKEAEPFQSYIQREESSLARAYGDRSIVKEFDQILSLIRNQQYEDSTLEISSYGSKPHATLEFDAIQAAHFHKVVSERRVGKPIAISAELRSLDAGRHNQLAQGKAKNLESGREFRFFVPSSSVFDRLARYLKSRRRLPVLLVACPIFEYNSFDPQAGDMMVIALQE